MKLCVSFHSERGGGERKRNRWGGANTGGRGKGKEERRRGRGDQRRRKGEKEGKEGGTKDDKGKKAEADSEEEKKEKKEEEPAVTTAVLAGPGPPAVAITDSHRYLSCCRSGNIVYTDHQFGMMPNCDFKHSKASLRMSRQRSRTNKASSLTSRG